MQIYTSKSDFASDMTTDHEVDVVICDKTGEIKIGADEFDPPRPSWSTTIEVHVGLYDDPEDGATMTKAIAYEWIGPDRQVVDAIPTFALGNLVEELDLWVCDQEHDCDAWRDHYAAEDRWVSNECGFAINSM